MKSRTKIYLNFMRQIKINARRFSNLETCPIEIDTNRSKFRKLMAYVEALPENRQAQFYAIVHRITNEYYRPIVLGRDGVMYSAADMDQAFMSM